MIKVDNIIKMATKYRFTISMLIVSSLISIVLYINYPSRETLLLNEHNTFSTVQDLSNRMYMSFANSTLAVLASLIFISFLVEYVKQRSYKEGTSIFATRFYTHLFGFVLFVPSLFANIDFHLVFATFIAAYLLFTPVYSKKMCVSNSISREISIGLTCIIKFVIFTVVAFGVLTLVDYAFGIF